MPSLGADMTEGTLLEWFVQPGDSVHRGDIVAVVDTSKSAIDIEVFEDGVVERLLVEPGTTIDVGTPMAILVPVGAGVSHEEPVAEPVEGRVEASVEEPVQEPVQVPVEPPPPPAAGVHVPASPLARRKAHELGLDLAEIRGTGSGGAVTMADVEAAAGHVAAPAPATPATPAPTPSPAPTVAPTPGRPGMHPQAMREAIAALMARSKKEIPHYYLQATIDMERSLTWLEHANAERSVSERLLPAALLLKATAMAVHEVPEMNGFLVDGVFAPSPQVHLGVAVSLRGGGLIAPALHDVDTLPLDTVMAALKDLGGRARGGKLRSSEMSDPTLTVTNLGDQGVDLVHGVIYPPQVALVGFGRIHQIPIAIDGMLAAHRCVIVTLAADHRVSDGHRGGLFLSAIDAALQKPEEL